MKYTMNICLAPGVWSKPIKITKEQFVKAMKNLCVMDFDTRIEEDDNWKLTYFIVHAAGKTDARVVFCKEELKREEIDADR